MSYAKLHLIVGEAADGRLLLIVWKAADGGAKIMKNVLNKLLLRSRASDAGYEARAVLFFLIMDLEWQCAETFLNSFRL